MGASDTAGLGARSWTEVGTDTVLVVPVGSTEQHGPHLPLDTDTVLATALAVALAGSDQRFVVAPPLAITASGEHRGFAGTLSIGTEIMAGVVIELARSAEWATGIVFVNGHGGNATAMQRASEVFDHERRNVLVWWPRIPDSDPHAGHTETSLMLAVAPERVRLDLAAPGPVPTIAELINQGVRPLSANGVLGDPTTATAEAGRELFATLREQLLDATASALESWPSR